MNTHSDVMIPTGEAILGRVIDYRGKPLDDLGALDTERVALRPMATLSENQPSGELLETGIKVIDLFVPLSRGGISFMAGPTGVGMLVVMMEIVYRLGRSMGSRAVHVTWKENEQVMRDHIREWREMGVDDRMTMVLGQAGDDLETRANTVRTAWNLAHNFAAQHRDVILSLATHESSLADLIAQLGTIPSQAANAFNGALTVFLLNFLKDGGAAQQPAQLRGSDAVLVFDEELARAKLWPAVSPTASRSLLLEKGGAARDHQQIARDALDLLQGYQEKAASGTADDQTTASARRLRNFLTQPFYTAEPWSGSPGESVRLVETLAAARAIIDGKLNDIPEEAFLYVGTIEQARDKARRMERA